MLSYYEQHSQDIGPEDFEASFADCLRMTLCQGL